MDTKRVIEQAAEMRERSGKVDDSRRLVAFLYVLMRDHITPGLVEDVMLKQLRLPDENSTPSQTEFSNGWLARHAQDVAARLTDASY